MSTGQVTTPTECNERCRPSPHAEAELEPTRDEVKPLRTETHERRGKRLIAHMAGRGDGVLSTDEIMRLTRGDE